MRDLKTCFSSKFATLIIEYVEEKRKSGYKYQDASICQLRKLDVFFQEQNIKKNKLTKELTEIWTQRVANESINSQQKRVGCLRDFAKFLVQRGISAYIPETNMFGPSISGFKPYIYSHNEINLLFAAADEMATESNKNCVAAVYPTVVRLLYSTGCRVGEIASLCWKDVDLDNGVLTILDGKHRRDRLVPLSAKMSDCMQKYVRRQRGRVLDALPVFHDPSKIKSWTSRLYGWFRKSLPKCGIVHGGKGPRLHDLRHTFAVHNLERWLQAGENPIEKLPILADYLGHQSILSTQYYLRLIPSIHEEVVKRMEKAIGSKIKRGGGR